MAVILVVMVLSLLVQGFMCSIGETNKGCMRWNKYNENVCCEACHPGHRLFRKCGPSPEDLCTPCEPGTYTVDPINPSCDRCTQCVGAQIELEACTATKDTKCGCIAGLTCGNDQCSFCVEKCGKGQEPTDNRSCRPCPKGTFNDQIHQMCKPWSTKCPNSGEEILTEGTAFSDINCTTITMSSKKKPDDSDQGWSMILSAFIVLTLMGMVIVVIIMTTTVAVKVLRKKNKTKKTVKKTPIIRTPTDDPRTLIAIECSFHEAQQEQGSSTESLDSKESTDQLIA
ncbi:hypothetical protein Q5P01_008000 [Channa striata]|uniref:TNFR-Cys domain-containing protein n=1 Tax=Channa striata TaxID=64152 RepID=A0AA88SUB5_CHASR|nr:hypothetical protein Q5P01_008000 [Channa striata]